jgi:DNA-binding beta-propeller fold protein YncE
MLRHKVAVLMVVCAAVASGCGSTEPADELMVTDNPVAATAAVSPEATTPPAGTVIQQAAVRATAFEPKTHTLAVATEGKVQLYRLGDTLSPTTTVDLTAESLTVDGTTFLVSGANKVVRLTTDGRTSPAAEQFRGKPVSATTYDGRTLVALRDERAVAIVRNERVQRLISGDLMSADQVLSTGRSAAVLDRLRNAVFELNVPDATIAQGLRAGQGATNAVTDRFGRILVTDTRGGALLAFSLDPLLLRQNYPVPGAPYAIAYDRERDIAWVTLTETNEVVGYEVAGEQPKERYRFPTVSQPNTVTVDPSSGRVIVASGTGDGIQVISL